MNSNFVTSLRVYGFLGKILSTLAGSIVGSLLDGGFIGFVGGCLGFSLGHYLEKLIIIPIINRSLK